MRSRQKQQVSVVVLPVLLVLARCAAGSASDSSESGSAGAPGFDACVGPSCGLGGGTGSGTGGGAGAPPEQEMESSFRSPVATGKYVWATNPESGRVALIDAKTLEVRTVEAGNGPTFLAALTNPKQPDQAKAIVLNVKSHDATVLSVDAKNEISSVTVEVHDDANSWAVSPGGRFAIAWTDSTQVPGADPTQGFQDITVIDLGGAKPTSTRLSVGYRPTRIFVSDDEQRAFAVTEPGISVIELTDPLGPVVSVDVPVTDDPLGNPASLDVSVTPNGAYALVRREGSSEVGIVSLSDGQRVTVKLSGPVTDLDLSDDGKRAIAVVRDPGGGTSPDAGTDAPGAGGTNGGSGASGSDGSSGAAGSDGSSGAAGSGGSSGAAGATGSGGAGGSGGSSGAAGATGSGGAAGAGGGGGSGGASPPDAAIPPSNSQVALLPIPEIFSAPSQFDSVTITGETVGSVVVSANGGVALLYTNATANDHLTILDTSPGATYLDHRTVALKAPVKAVFPADDGGHAIALLATTGSSSKAGAFSIVPVAAKLPPKIQGTDAPPVGVAIQPGQSTRALVTVSDKVAKKFATYLVRMPELQVDPYTLASPPLATGIVPFAGTGYVAQEHPEGRITFVNLADGKARTLTGFELGAKVVDGNP